MADSDLDIKLDGNRVHIHGSLDVISFRQAEKKLRELTTKVNIFDLSKVTRLDTAGALLLYEATKKNIKLENLCSEHKALFDLVRQTKPKNFLQKSLVVRGKWG